MARTADRGQRGRYGALVAGVAAYWALKAGFPSVGNDPSALPFGEAIGWCALSALNQLAWILTLIGFLTRWLHRSSPVLTYATEAALPVYMVQQTLIVIAVFQLHQVDWPLGVKLATTFGFALLGSLALHEFVIRRSAWLRLLFGVKGRARESGPEVFAPAGGPMTALTNRLRAPSS